MKTTTLSRLWRTVLLSLLFPGIASSQNAFHVDGAIIYLESAASLHILGDLETKNAGQFTNTGTVHITGNMVHNGTGTLNAVSAGLFRYNGTGNQYISGSNQADFYDLAIDKTAGECRLQTGVRVSNQISFISGNIFLNDQTIDLLSTGELNGETETSGIYDQNTGTGTVITTRVLNSPALQNPGNLGAIISSSQNLGSTTVIRGHQSQFILSGNSINRYYDIIPGNNSSLNATLRFQYFESELNGQREVELVQWHLPAGNIVWLKRGGTSSIASNYVELPGIDSFNSRISLISQNTTPLPLKLLEFKASKTNLEQVLLQWKTSEEVNCSHFEVERSLNGVHWILLGIVPALGQNGQIQYYSFNDPSPSSGNNYYRLKQVDIDGEYDYSPVKKIQFGKPAEIRVYPSILAQFSQLFVEGISPEKALISLFDNKGQLLFTTTLNSNSFYLPQLVPGIYHIRVTDKSSNLVAGTRSIIIF